MPAAQLQFDHLTVGGDFTLRGVTIQQYFGAAPPANRDSRNRRAMLEKVWAIWITGVLQPSLPHDILLDLGLAERPAMVARSLDLYVQRPDLADQVEAPSTRLVDVFDRLDRALVILGAPGAGKTTLLLTLAQALLIRAAQDPEQPIPVVFPLSSWSERQRPLASWLVDALNEQYDVPRKTGQAWVDMDHILPLLDGLDEVVPEHRAACVEAINTFRQEHGLLPMVVCSRVADYEAVGAWLRLQGALVVQPLMRSAVEGYLTQVGQPMAAVRDALGDNPTLWELVDTPLMLTIVTLVYAGESGKALHMGGTPAEQQQHLFAAYVDKMFRRRGASSRYSQEQAKRWVSWLAWQMGRHNQTIFYLERMQPDWLPQRQRWVPTQGTRLITGLLGWLGGGLLPGLFFGVLSDEPYEGLFIGLVIGLVTGLVGSVAGSSKEIMSIETVHWSGRRFLAELLLPSGRKLGTALFLGLSVGLGTGLLAGLLEWRAAGQPHMIGIKLVVGLVLGFGTILGFGLGAPLAVGLVVALVWGLDEKLKSGARAWLGTDLPFDLGVALILGLVIAVVAKLGAGLVAGLSGSEIAAKTFPNQGIRRSARMASIIGLGGAVGGGLLIGLLSQLGGEPFDVFIKILGSGLVIGLVIGLLPGIWYGWRTCLQHLLLRLMLKYNGATPWRYADFLDYAAERIFLRKVGGGYSFIHRLLQEYFASRHVDPGSGATQ